MEYWFLGACLVNYTLQSVSMFGSLRIVVISALVPFMINSCFDCIIIVSVYYVSNNLFQGCVKFILLGEHHQPFGGMSLDWNNMNWYVLWWGFQTIFTGLSCIKSGVCNQSLITLCITYAKSSGHVASICCTSVERWWLKFTRLKSLINY